MSETEEPDPVWRYHDNDAGIELTEGMGPGDQWPERTIQIIIPSFVYITPEQARAFGTALIKAADACAPIEGDGE